ncbi:MAG TPA: hypothetical protein C5S51_10385 [Methanosarcinaceae archaeon]|nr:hypothetical protein [Methanosarcinaceae archaeon]
MLPLTSDTVLINTRDFDSNFGSPFQTNSFDVNQISALTIETNMYFGIKSDNIQNKINDWNSKMRYSRKPCLGNDSASKSMLKISRDIREMANDNKLFNTILQTTFSEISFLLDKDDIVYQINVDVEEDKEFPEWKETVVSIEISNINQEEVFQIWETIENQIQCRINRMDNETIKEKYENLILIVNNFE